MNDNEFLTFDHHLDLDAAFEEIKWLYLEYGLHPDEKLSVGGKELKQKILKFVDDVSKLPRCSKAIWENGKCKGYCRGHVLGGWDEEPVEICRNCKDFELNKTCEENTD